MYSIVSTFIALYQRFSHWCLGSFAELFDSPIGCTVVGWTVRSWSHTQHNVGKPTNKTTRGIHTCTYVFRAFSFLRRSMVLLISLCLSSSRALTCSCRRFITSSCTGWGRVRHVPLVFHVTTCVPTHRSPHHCNRRITVHRLVVAIIPHPTSHDSKELTSQ